MAAAHKEHVRDPEKKLAIFVNALGVFDKTFRSSPLAEKITTAIKQDEQERLKRLDESRESIKKIVDFFKPDIRTSNIHTVALVPTDPLYRKNSGRGFSALPGEHMIVSHIENTQNQDHEFTHGIINPIVDKLSDRLTTEQKQTVSRMANADLRQDYGDGHYSLLCEEFIRTYTELVAGGKEVETRQDFMQKVAQATEEQFQDALGNGKFRTACAEMEIKTVSDFKEKSGAFFERYRANPLRALVFELYQEYVNRPDQSENFEQFILTALPKALS